jgi:hypothetical protein
VILAEGRTTIPENFAYDANVGQGAGLAGALTIPNSVTTIGNYAFVYNSLTSVTIGTSVTTIGSMRVPHANSTLATVILAEGRTTIPENFAYDANVGQAEMAGALTIPNSVTSIGSIAFAYNSLTSVTIPQQRHFDWQQCVLQQLHPRHGELFYHQDHHRRRGQTFSQAPPSPLTINVPTSGAVADTWTAGTGLSIGGNTNVTVAKNL